MRHALTSIAALALALFSAGCPTAFTGNAHVTDGKAGCERKCKQSGLRFSGMVFLGEYSSACMCEPKSSAAVDASAAPSPATLSPTTISPAAPPQQTPGAPLPTPGATPAAPAAAPPAAPPAAPARPTSGGARPAGAAAGAAVAVMLQQVRDDEAYTPYTLSE